MWHFCASCAHWPIDAYVACVKVAGDCAVCTEWIVEYERGFLASPRQASLNVPQQNVTDRLRADDDCAGAMIVRLVIFAHRPLAEMAD